jgi:hypothetical protein
MYARDAVSIRTAAHVHGVPVAIVSLPRKVSIGMAIHAARKMQHWDHGFKRPGSRRIITRRRSTSAKELCLVISCGECLSPEMKYQPAGHDYRGQNNRMFL